MLALEGWASCLHMTCSLAVFCISATCAGGLNFLDFTLRTFLR